MTSINVWTDTNFTLFCFGSTFHLICSKYWPDMTILLILSNVWIDSISPKFLVNFVCGVRQILTINDIIVAWWLILSNVRTYSNLTWFHFWSISMWISRATGWYVCGCCPPNIFFLCCQLHVVGRKCICADTCKLLTNHLCWNGC